MNHKPKKQQQHKTLQQANNTGTQARTQTQRQPRSATVQLSKLSMAELKGLKSDAHDQYDQARVLQQRAQQSINAIRGEILRRQQEAANAGGEEKKPQK